MSATSTKSRSSLRRVILASLAVALAILGGTAVVVGYAAVAIDRLEASKEQALIERSVGRTLARMRENVTSATIWTEAYLKTAGQYDQAWAQANYGDYYADYMKQEVSLGYDNRGRLVYASRDSEPVRPASEAALARAVEPLVRSVRAESARKRFDAKGRRQYGFKAVATREGIVSADGALYLVAVSSTVPEDAASARFTTPDPVVASAHSVPTFLTTMGGDLAISQPRLVTGDAQASGPSVVLRGPDNAPLAQVRWTPDRPGLDLLRQAQGFAWLLVLLVAAASAMLLARVTGVLRDLDRNEKTLTDTLEDLTRARDEAEAGNRAKSQFLANMSHELRTPLNAVIAIAELLGPQQVTDEGREMTTLIAASGRTLEQVVNDILDIAKIEDGHLTLSDIPFDLTLTLSQIADLHAAVARAKGLMLERDIDPALAGLYRGDAGRLSQIVSNLLNNAVKFTAAGTVRLVARRRGAAVSISVSDQGIGFDGATRRRLFQRFEQADSTITRRFGGTGLGLSISAALVAMMGGKLAARSMPGKGSVFRVSLPLQRVEAAAAEPVSAAESAQADAAAFAERRPLRILLAEDHPTNQRVVAMILAALGVDLTVVADGAQALADACRGGFDLVLMDVQMPVMDGLTATRRLREHEAANGLPRVPVVSLTANAMAEHVEASLAAGSDRHLSKPIRPDALIACVLDLTDPSRVRPSDAAQAAA